MKVSVLKGFARHGVCLAVLMVLMLGMAAVSHAQAAGASAQPAAKTALSAAAAQTAGGTAPGRERAAIPAPKAGGGLHQGIQVHGHWVIEVRNPDGTLAQRREFENSLQASGQLGIAALLAGNVTGGGLAIALNGKSIQWFFSITGGVSVTSIPPSSPCTFESSKKPGPCLITSYNSGQQPFINFLCNVPTASFGCSFNLSVAAPVLGNYLVTSGSGYNLYTYGINGSNTVTLTGSIVAAAPGTLTDVETWGFACVTGVTAQACNSYATPVGLASKAPEGVFYTLTERDLDGLNGDPNSVTVAAMQSVNVTVTLSFGS